MNAHASLKPRYASPAAVRRYVAAARDMDLDVAGFEVAPDGTIRILDARMLAAKPTKDLFEELDAAGRL
jgi:hypothetical protein